MRTARCVTLARSMGSEFLTGELTMPNRRVSNQADDASPARRTFWLDRCVVWSIAIAMTWVVLAICLNCRSTESAAVALVCWVTFLLAFIGVVEVFRRFRGKP